MRSQPRSCAVRSLAGSLFLFRSLSFLPFFLTLSGSARPLDLNADRSRSVYNARRGARPWSLPPPPSIYSGRSDGRSNLGTSTNPYCATRTRESRIVLGPASLLSFFRRALRRSSALREEGGERTSGVAATRRRRMRRRRDDGEVTEKKTETDGEPFVGMRLGDQKKRRG